MPLTSKGQKIKTAMQKEYGADKGERVFYASENKGTIKGVAEKPITNTSKSPTTKTLTKTGSRRKVS